MPPRLFVPPKVAAELAEETRLKFRAVLDAVMDYDDPVCKDWNPELRKLDPLIKLGRAKPMAYVPGYPVRAGFYHFLRDNPGAPPTVEAITGPDDGWTEPDSSLLRKLRANDLQNPQVIVAIEADREQRKQEAEKEKLRDREERQDEMVGRWVAGHRTQVSMNRDTPWTQNASPASRRDAKQRRKAGQSPST